MSAVTLKKLLKAKKSKKYTIPLLYAGMFLGVYAMPSILESKEIPYSYTTEFANTLYRSKNVNPAHMYQLNNNGSEFPLAFSTNANISRGYTHEASGRYASWTNQYACATERTLYTNFTVIGNFEQTNSGAVKSLLIDMNNSSIGGSFKVGINNSTINLRNSTFNGRMEFIASGQKITLASVTVDSGTSIVTNNNANVTVKNSSVNGDFFPHGDTTISIQDSTIVGQSGGLAITGADANRFALNIQNSKLERTINIGGTTTATIMNSTIDKDLWVNIGGKIGNATISITNSSIYSLGMDVGNNSVSLTNSTIGGRIRLGSGNNLLNLKGITLNNQMDLSQGRNTINLLGNASIAITGSTALTSITSRNARNRLSLTNSSIGAISFDNNKDYLHLNNSTIWGAVDLGGGVNTVIIDRSIIQSFSIGSAILGDATIGSTLDITNSTINGELRFNFGGANATIQNSSIHSITASDDNYHGLGVSTYTINNSTIRAGITLAGNVNLSITNNSSIVGDIASGDSEGTTISVNNSSVFGGITPSYLGGSTVAITDGLLTGDIYVGDKPLNNISLTNSTIGGIIDGGANNIITLERMDIDGDKFRLTSGNNTISVNSSTITNNITTGDGHDSISLTKSIVGNNIALGTGNNTIELLGGSMVQNISLGSTDVNNTFINNVTIHDSTMAGTLDFDYGTMVSSIQNSSIGTITSRNNNYHSGPASTHTISNSTVGGGIVLTGSFSLSIDNNTSITGGVDATDSHPNTISIENSSVFGDIIPGHSAKSRVTLTNTLIDGNVNGGRNTDNTFFFNNSTVNNNIEGGDAVNNITINNSTIVNNITTGTADDSITLTNSSIGGTIDLGSGNNTLALQTMKLDVISLLQGNNTISANNSTIANGITTGSGNDNITIDASTITGNITTGNTGDDYLSLTNSSVGGTINLGAGNNTLTLQTMNLDRISLLQGNNTISLTNSTIANAIITDTGHDNITLTNSTAKNLTAGAGNNTISIDRSQLDALILNEGQNTVHVNGATIRGALGTAGNNTIALSESYIGGNISASNFTLTNGLYFQNTAGGGTINRTINAQNITMNDGFIYTNPNTPGDVLYIEGNVSTTATKSPSFILDTDMSAGVVDKIHFDGTVTSPDNVLLVATQNAKTITRTSATVTRVSNVISFVNNTNITLPTLYIGGSEYAFEEGVIPNSWDLVKVGASKYNEGFSAMEASNKRHSTLVWNTLNKRMDNALLEYAMEATPIGKKVTKKIKRGKKLYAKTFYQWPKSKPQDKITIWANGQANINFLTQKDSLSMHELMAMGTFGVDIKKLDIRNILRFNVHIFGAYGKGMSTIKASDSPVRMDGDINAISAGAFVSMETLKSFKYKYFVRVGVWTDLFQNSLQYNDPTRLQNTDTWGTYAINASVSTGVRINVRRFTIVPELGVAYTYTPGTNFVAGDSALIEFQEDHRLIAKATLLTAYNFKFGLKPYAKIGVEMPFSVAGSGGVYVGDNQRKYIYEINELQAIASIGLNYSVQVRGVDISTYIDVATNLGKKQQGVTGNLGISLGF